MIQKKRIYDERLETDGYRILVDRLWPRGIKKENAFIDYWAKEITPSNELRKWFNHEPEKFSAFSLAYKKELLSNEEAGKTLQWIREKGEQSEITLVYAAKSLEYNHVVVLLELLQQKKG